MSELGVVLRGMLCLELMIDATTWLLCGLCSSGCSVVSVAVVALWSL